MRSRRMKKKDEENKKKSIEKNQVNKGKKMINFIK